MSKHDKQKKPKPTPYKECPKISFQSPPPDILYVREKMIETEYGEYYVLHVTGFKFKVRELTKKLEDIKLN
jgi:hypothetical protein